jgi:ABC-2 type transport system permease protein
MEFPMDHFVVLLLSARLRLMWNGFRRGKVGAKIGWIIAAIALLGGAAFSGFAGFGLSKLLEVFTRPDVRAELQQLGLPMAQIQPQVLLASLLSLLVLAVWGIVLLSSLGAALNSFYLASDLDLLVAAPIPMRAIFAAKYAEGLGIGYLLLFALGGPALVGLGVGAGYPGLYFVAAVLVLLLLPLVPESVGTLLVMPLVRIIPPKRLREALQVLGALVGASFYFFSQLSQGQEMAPETAGRLVRWLYRLNLPFLPQAWPAQSLLMLGQGRTLEGLAALVAFAVLSIGFLALSLLLAERLYYSGWANLRAEPAGRRRPKREERPAMDLAFLPRPVQGLLLKDLRLFVRDPQGWSEMLMPVAVYALFIVQGLRQNNVLGDYAEFALLGMGIFVFFLANSMVSRLGLGGIGSEAKQVWLIKIAPVAPRRILWAKFIAAYLPFVLFGGLLLLGLTLAHQAAVTFFLGAWLLIALLGVGSIGTAVGLGAAFPRFEVQRRRQHVSPGAGCLYFPIIILYALVVTGLLLVPPLADALLKQLGVPAIATVLWVIGPTGAVVLTAVALFLPLRIGAERLGKLEV